MKEEREKERKKGWKEGRKKELKGRKGERKKGRKEERKTPWHPKFQNRRVNFAARQSHRLDSEPQISS